MSGELEAAGDFITGGIVGRAIEGGAGEHAAHAHGDRCLNCAATLGGDYCHNCGQPGHVHKTLMSIVHDVLHGVFHFEGKVWNTLPMLFTRPGQLTRRYIDGERVRFVSPLALFLFSVFLMVATFETIGGPFGGTGGTGDNGSVIKLNTQELTNDIAKQKKLQTQVATEQAALKARRDAVAAKGGDTDALDTQIDTVDTRAEKIDDELEKLQSAKGVLDGTGDIGTAMDKNNVSVQTGSPSLDKKIGKALKSPELYAYKLQSNAYKFSWLLVPISLPFIWLLFAFRRDVGPYDHAIFAIYSLSAMTMGVVALSIMRSIGIPGGAVATLFVLGPPLHMYKQLRGTYGIGRFGAAWRTFALLVSASIAGGLFFAAIVGLAA